MNAYGLLQHRFGTEKLYAQKEDLLHEVLELEAEKGLLVSSDSAKYQVSISGSMFSNKEFFNILHSCLRVKKIISSEVPIGS